MTGQLLIVDGHNAILGLKEFMWKHAQNPASTRDELIDWLSRYQSASEDAVVIVFDGKGGIRDIQEGDEGEAMVIYASAKESADAVIEQLASQQSKKRRVLVATNDRLIQNAVNDCGGEALSLAALELRVETQLSSWRGHWGIQAR